MMLYFVILIKSEWLCALLKSQKGNVIAGEVKMVFNRRGKNNKILKKHENFCCQLLNKKKNARTFFLSYHFKQCTR